MIMVKKKRWHGISDLFSFSDFYSESAHCTSKSKTFLAVVQANSIWYLKVMPGA